nr:hypothetical protein [Tanacetum cinerariifolium]
MSRDVFTVGSTMRIPLLYRGEYPQWVERFMNYLEEQTVTPRFLGIWIGSWVISGFGHGSGCHVISQESRYIRMLVPHLVNDHVANDVDVDDVVADVAEPTSPTPATTPPPPQEFSLLHHRKVEALEQDKIAQAIEITKLKQRVKKLEKKRKLKVYGLKRLRKIRTAQRVESSADTVMDDQEDTSKQGDNS